MITTTLGREVFYAVPEQVGEARRWLRTLLGDGCGDAMECLSEVFTNAIVHSSSGLAQGPVSVVVLDVPPLVHVEVSDAGGHTKPHVLPLDDAKVDGRGLYLVDALTVGRWGWDDREMGRTVWFEVRRN